MKEGTFVQLKDSARRVIWHTDPDTRERVGRMETQRPGILKNRVAGSPSSEMRDGDLPIFAPFHRWEAGDGEAAPVESLDPRDGVYFARLDELEEVP